MTKDEIGIELARRLSGALAPGQRATWRSASYVAPGQSLGESLVRFALYVVPLQGLICFAHRHDNKAYLTIADRWLGRPLPPTDPAQARAELVRRYLRCYGPSTAGHYAEWAGIAPAQASRAWALVDDELAGVDLDGRRAWLLREDLARLRSPRAATGARFLPPHEPLLQLRDRDTLIPDKAWHRKLWRPVGNPGVVLAEGRPVAAWRSRKSGKRMSITLEPFAAIPEQMRPAVEAEAATLGPFSGCTSVKVGYV